MMCILYDVVTLVVYLK